MKGESDFVHMLPMHEEKVSPLTGVVGFEINVLPRAVTRTKKKLMKRLYNIEIRDQSTF